MPHVAPAFHIQNLWKEEAVLSLRPAYMSDVVAFRPSQSQKAGTDLEKQVVCSHSLGQETSTLESWIIKASLILHDILLHVF